VRAQKQQVPPTDKQYTESLQGETESSDHVGAIDENGHVMCVAEALDWCNLPPNQKQYDVVLAFECVYREDLYLPLINALSATSHEGSYIFLGLTRLFIKPYFFDLLKQHGFSYQMIPQESLPLEYQEQTSGRDVGLFILRKKIKQ